MSSGGERVMSACAAEGSWAGGLGRVDVSSDEGLRGAMDRDEWLDDLVLSYLVLLVLVLGAGWLLSSWWRGAMATGICGLLLVALADVRWGSVVRLVMGCSWVVGGVVLALMRWQAGAGPGVVGAGLLVCAGVLVAAQARGLGGADEGVRDELGQ